MEKAMGVNFLVFVKDKDEPGTFLKIAGQRGATLNRSRETIDSTTKDSEGFKEKEYGDAEWGIDCDGLVVESDAAWQRLEDAFLNKEKLDARFQTQAGKKYEGQVLLTDFPIEAPYDAEATYSMTFEGDGPYKPVAAEPPAEPPAGE